MTFMDEPLPPLDAEGGIDWVSINRHVRWGFGLITDWVSSWRSKNFYWTTIQAVALHVAFRYVSLIESAGPDNAYAVAAALKGRLSYVADTDPILSNRQGAIMVDGPPHATPDGELHPADAPDQQ